jgi:hypothetical protein
MIGGDRYFIIITVMFDLCQIFAHDPKYASSIPSIILLAGDVIYKSGLALCIHI